MGQRNRSLILTRGNKSLFLQKILIGFRLTQTSVKCLPVTCYLGIKRLNRGSWPLLPSGSKVKNDWSSVPTPWHAPGKLYKSTWLAACSQRRYAFGWLEPGMEHAQNAPLCGASVWHREHDLRGGGTHLTSATHRHNLAPSTRVNVVRWG
jgi:hypothetical protein